MKTMKLWRIAFMMLAAFSLASCSSDDDITNNEQANHHHYPETRGGRHGIPEFFDPFQQIIINYIIYIIIFSYLCSVIEYKG